VAGEVAGVMVQGTKKMEVMVKATSGGKVPRRAKLRATFCRQQQLIWERTR
jgi:hypothetical protein